MELLYCNSQFSFNYKVFMKDIGSDSSYFLYNLLNSRSFVLK
jgi:hypothetical protein